MGSVGMRIKLVRESLGMTATELAEKVGMPKQNIYKYERKITKNIPYQTLGRLARALDVNPSYLAGWTETKERPNDLLSEV